MMKAAFSLLALISTIGFANAGGFGGPPPFTNGSPLESGTDGTYQAVASATNVTGILSFQIANGAQTSTLSANSWVFFVDGNVLSGSVSANISNSKVSGVMDGGASGGIATNTDGTVTLPALVVVPGNAASGYFNGKIDLNSPIAAFSGKGALEGTPERTDQLVFIDSGGVTITPVTIPGSTFDKTEFKFRGTRVSTATTSATTTTTDTTQ